MSAPQPGKGFAFKGKAKKVEKVPEALADVGSPQKEAGDIRPAPMTTAVRAMFGRPPIVAAPSVAAPSVAAAKPKVLKAAAAAAPKATSAAAPVPKAPAVLRAEAPPFAPSAAVPSAAAPKPNAAPKPKPTADTFEDVADRFPDELREMGMLIREEETKDPYENPAPAAFVPESRRGFSEFIKVTYDNFMLEAVGAAKETPPGEKYPYQKFVREYMRQDSPYRGLLVYHGLGSGKTCTAIAASEALFSTAHKKIIVMTPFSLRKNFLKEVTLCGFRHFQLQNYWVQLPADDPTARLFATSALGLSEASLNRATSIWVPDFRKTAAEANYSKLSADQQTEIRQQILSVLIWDEVKNPNGRIRFINYNGITKQRLQELACKEPPDFFDDAVIIVDEIHNLVRTIQGKIDPYLLDMPGMRRVIQKEEIGVGHWKPKLCSKEEAVAKPTLAMPVPAAADPKKAKFKKYYMRGYLFYRLLLGAQNSKLIGLSGTPLINFPEELGILMNVLHGYIPTLDVVVDQVGEAAQAKLRSTAMKHPFLDFVDVAQDPKGGGTILTATLLPYRTRKLDNETGVERIPEGEPAPTAEEIVKSVQEALTAAGFRAKGELSLKAKELLPPFGSTFSQNFLLANGELNNKSVLVKRMTGLISYYKGSRADLMPRVKVDEVVRVPMSLYSQKKYVAVRQEEVSKEKKKKETSTINGFWAEVLAVGKGKASSNYKTASRQACNFTFPPGVERPDPTEAERAAEAAEADVGGELLDTAPDGEEGRDAEGFPELEAEAGEEDRQVEEDEEEVVVAAAAAPVPAAQSGGQPVGDEALSGAPSAAPSEALQPKKFSLKEVMAKRQAAAAAARAAELEALKPDCKVGRKPGETYDAAKARAETCLRSIFPETLRLGAPEGLEVYAPKYAEMLRRIEAAPGSSLVYSQFLSLEGIGLFRVALDVNGYAPIEIQKTPGGSFVFSKETEASFRKGPGVQPRYITFSGKEEDEVRRLALDIFNARFNELPEGLKSVLISSGYTNNHRGEICRVFCITKAGAEGLSLKCVRAVHVMEPYWNAALTAQVKGRAIRIGSHLELPESDRDVSIYTYLSCFPKESQLAKGGDERIDETIRNADRVDKQAAVELGLPIPPGAADYVLTTDERIYLIGQRKKKLMDALESLMKAAAVDCELNIKQNRDGTFKCLPLRGKVGDFLYHPDLEKDIKESASKYEVVAAGPPPAPAPSAAAPAAAAAAPSTAAPVLRQKFKDKIYRMKPVRGDGAVVTGFEMYADDDPEMKRLLGRAGAKGDRPAPPVSFL